VIETPDGNLSKGMRQLNGIYTQVGISHQTDRLFRSIPAGHFARFRPPISEHSGPFPCRG
jgi:hypothetical protein